MSKPKPNATHTEPTLDVTQKLPDAPKAPETMKVSMSESESRVRDELANVNAKITAGADPTDDLKRLRLNLQQWNEKLVEARVREFGAMDVIPLFKEFIENPRAVTYKAMPDKATHLYDLRESSTYVDFQRIDSMFPTSLITPAHNWAQLVKIFRWNIVRFSARDDGKFSTTDFSLTTSDFNKAHELGWDGVPSMRSLNEQLNIVTQAIIPGEICPKLMARADLKQLMRAVLPEKGENHETKVLIKNLAVFEQKLFAVIRTRMQNGTYAYQADKDDANPADADAAKNGPVECSQTDAPAEDFEDTQDESANS